MPTHHVLILGAGAAGVAAATALARHEDIHVTLVGRTHETPYIRMHITGVARLREVDMKAVSVAQTMPSSPRTQNEYGSSPRTPR